MIVRISLAEELYDLTKSFAVLASMAAIFPGAAWIALATAVSISSDRLPCFRLALLL